ncbi:serine hydrolase [Actinosynnema sp. NPDC050436]|uniref:serine hydrolase n=1 Tax=Actinosynnema sp. NPDC050436 TaxID=3155659 RepID=UPI0033CAD561
MHLTRRHLLSACGVAGSALLLPAMPAAADPGPENWLDHLRANREHFAAVVDDGKGRRFAHRPHERHLLASAVKVVHLVGYDLAVRRGQVDAREPVRVGDWEQYYLPLDGGAHPQALRALDLECSNGFTADDPNALVTLDDLASVMIRYSDNAATDYLLHRLGEPVVRTAAVRAGWPDAPIPSVLGHWLRIVLGREVDVREYLDDPRLRLEVIGRLPDVPREYERVRPLMHTTWRGTAAGLHRLHRTLDRFPRALSHLERGQVPPDGVAGIGLKGGSVPGVLTLGCRVRWQDGRVGTAVVLVEEVDETWYGRAAGLVELVLDTLLDRAGPGLFQVGLS